MFNRTRQLYNQASKNRKPSKEEIRKIIEDGQAVQNFRKSRIAKLLEDWIEAQRKGQQEYLQAEIGSLNGLGILKFFNAFLKYVYMLQENRAYRKIEAFLDSIERNGAKYEERQRRESAKNSQQSDNR